MEAPTVNVMDEELVKAFFKKVGEFHHLTTPGSEARRGRHAEVGMQ
jgi:hypothetical protein